MLHNQERSIGEFTFYVSDLPAQKLRHLTVRLAKILGPSIGGLFMGQDARKGLDMDMDIGTALKELFDKLNENDFDYLCYAFVGSAGVNKKPFTTQDEFDAFFRGKFKLMFDFLKFALEVQYGPLLSGLNFDASDLFRREPKETPVSKSQNI